MTKDKFLSGWPTAFVLISLIASLTIIILGSHPLTIRFEADNNMVQIVEGLNLTTQKFKCNPYYKDTVNCQNFFINQTGNYCNGRLICQNEI